MNKSFLARSLHKWFGLIVGLQVLIWLATGLYMVVLDLDFIHGDPLVRNMLQTVTVPGSSRVSVAALRAQYTDATDIGLRPVMGTSFFTVTTPENRYLINPQSAQVISPLDEEFASKIAVFHFNGGSISMTVIRPVFILTPIPEPWSHAGTSTGAFLISFSCSTSWITPAGKISTTS